MGLWGSETLGSECTTTTLPGILFGFGGHKIHGPRQHITSSLTCGIGQHTRGDSDSIIDVRLLPLRNRQVRRADGPILNNPSRLDGLFLLAAKQKTFMAACLSAVTYLEAWTRYNSACFAGCFAYPKGDDKRLHRKANSRLSRLGNYYPPFYYILTITGSKGACVITYPGVSSVT